MTADKTLEAVARALCEADNHAWSVAGADHKRTYLALARAALAAAEACGVTIVPEGWQIAPRNPTDEMIIAATLTRQMKTIDGVLSLHQARTASYGTLELGATAGTSAIAEAYRAMLSAAPAPPKVG